MFLDEEDEEFVTSGGGIYRVRDNISNFRFRINVRKIELHLDSSDSSKEGTSSKGNDGYEEDEDEEQEDSPRGGSSDEYFENDSVTLRWQQKIFSKDEIEKYSSAHESDFGEDEVLAKKFYHDVQKLKNETKKCQFGRIYTCIDGEICKEKETLINESPLVCDKKIMFETEPNYLTSMMADGLRRRLHQTVTMPSTDAGIISSSENKAVPNIVIDKPSRETQIRLHTANLESSEHMIIKFDAPTGSTVDLCSIKLSSNSILEVIPDFTFNKKPYKIEIDGKVCYEYWIEHSSPTIKYEDQLKETLMMNQVLNHHASFIASEVGKEFESPKVEDNDRIFRLCVNGEIVSAKDYDYDNLFVHYFIDVPSGWKEYSKNSGHGMTTTCKTNSKGEAHFCTMFNTDFSFDINRLDYYNFCTWPTIFVEVISIDSWTRLRTEGYGYLTIPYYPGTYNLKIDTWRPLMSNPQMARIGEMRRYFIGGTPELDDLTSSYGNASGHSWLKKKSGGVEGNRRLFLDRIASASLFHSVTSVINEFGKAKERILRASKGLENEDEVAKIEE
ncbi:MKS1 [Lepeophtheirus salmonis]|uniref:MKS1 n=1 Tax=Lepeophtheirus salmonis TaxID=72036 RepID=A0A7R8HCX1_LEPSM|nr:MKS1 [Lepeophtheirus salmonis]CAF3015165.1 MKS1 [Lepeophtheirus salmonis]